MRPTMVGKALEVDGSEHNPRPTFGIDVRIVERPIREHDGQRIHLGVTQHRSHPLGIDAVHLKRGYWRKDMCVVRHRHTIASLYGRP